MTDPDRSENRALQAIKNYERLLKEQEAILAEDVASKSMAEQHAHHMTLESIRNGLLVAIRQLPNAEKYLALQISPDIAITTDHRRVPVQSLAPDTVVTRDIIAELSERARQIYKLNSLLGSTPKQ